MGKPTCGEIASNWSLWQQYYDRNATYTYEEWDALSYDEALALIHEAFPGECNCEDDED